MIFPSVIGAGRKISKVHEEGRSSRHRQRAGCARSCLTSIDRRRKMTISEVATLVQEELAKIGDVRVQERIRSLIVSPYCVDGEWDYGKEGQTYPCWIILEHPASGTGIAYCEDGFGPSNPWGLVWIMGPHRQRIGMDSGWYDSLGDAFRESHAWQELSS